MKLTAQQAAQFQRDGFLVFPELFSQAEIDVLHEDDGATRSAAFRSLVRAPRVLEPTMQVLQTEGVYVYHTKINTKPLEADDAILKSAALDTAV